MRERLEAGLKRQRVASLLPSATEIVCALGEGDALVGISHECDFPESIRNRPVLTSARITASSSSREIDARVREAIRDALSVYTVDEAQLAALAPDVIVTQDLCEVCAVSLDDVRSAVARLAHRESIQIVSLRPTRFDHVLADVMKVADALGVPERGRAVRQEMELRVSAISKRASTANPERPRVVSIEWLDPIMLGGTWMPELIELAGGLAVGVEKGALARTVSKAELAEMEPDVVVIKPCGFTIARTLEERSVVAEIASTVGPGARVFVTDGNAFFNRPGPRLVESLEIMAACVHPARFADLLSLHAGDIAITPPAGWVGRGSR